MRDRLRGRAGVHILRSPSVSRGLRCGHDSSRFISWSVRSLLLSTNRPAEQGARANATTCHDPCFRTARAKWRRGSSLTFGNCSRAVPMTASVSIRVRGLAGTDDQAGVRCWHGRRKAAAIAADRGREFSDGKHRGARHACGTASSVGPACVSSGPEASGPDSAVGTPRRDSFPGQFEAFSFRRIGPPNKAPEPTPPLVTIRAFARLAPSGVVAHL
jgi:hypothetical protein